MMRPRHHILICFILFLCLVDFSASVIAAPAVTAVTAGETQTLGKMPEGPPPIQEHKIALAPFYRLRSNGSKTWMERILVTFTMAAPKTRLNHEIDNPTFRKIFYELLLSGEPEATIRAQAVDHLQRQVGMKVDPAVEISRSVLIVR